MMRFSFAFSCNTWHLLLSDFIIPFLSCFQPQEPSLWLSLWLSTIKVPLTPLDYQGKSNLRQYNPPPGVDKLHRLGRKQHKEPSPGKVSLLINTQSILQHFLVKKCSFFGSSSSFEE